MQRRNTIQRQTILDAVLKLNHPNADEVYCYLKKSYPNLSKGTVYRNLNVLVEEQHILKVTTTSGSDRFDYVQPQHYHMRCTSCGRIFDAHLPLYQPPKELPTPCGNFSIEQHTLELIGTCSDCLNKFKH